MNTEQRFQQLETQIKELTNRLDLLNSYSSIPLSLEKALQARGFLKSSDILISGEATIGVGGETWIPLNGVSLNAIGFAVYANGTGSDIGCIMLNTSATYPNTTQLYLNGTGSASVYYVVFKTADKSL